MVKLEALTIYYGNKQCYLYLSGMPRFEAIKDHQPLKTVFNRKDVVETDNDKLMKIRHDLQSKYVFTIKYRNCTSHGVPGALGRIPVNNPDKDEHSEIKIGHVAAITEFSGIENSGVSKLEDGAKKDEKYKVLDGTVLSTFAKYKHKYAK